MRQDMGAGQGAWGTIHGVQGVWSMGQGTKDGCRAWCAAGCARTTVLGCTGQGAAGCRVLGTGHGAGGPRATPDPALPPHSGGA